MRGKRRGRKLSALPARLGIGLRRGTWPSGAGRLRRPGGFFSADEKGEPKGSLFFARLSPAPGASASALRTALRKGLPWASGPEPPGASAGRRSYANVIRGGRLDLGLGCAAALLGAACRGGTAVSGRVDGERNGRVNGENNSHRTTAHQDNSPSYGSLFDPYSNRMGCGGTCKRQTPPSPPHPFPSFC